MSKRSIAILFVLVALAVVATLPATAAWQIPGDKPQQQADATRGGGLDGTGVVQYDPPGPFDEMVGNAGNFVGNVFDTRAGNPLETGSVSLLAFYIGGADATFPFWGIFNAAGTSALFTSLGSGIVPFTFNTVPIGIAGVAPGFLGGVLVSPAFTSSADSVGAQSQSTLGQGFHAASFGGGVIPIANRNAMVRVSGSVWVVPVELMSFDVSK